MASVACDMDKLRIAQLLNTLADRAGDGAVAAELAADIANRLPRAYCVGTPGCIQCNLPAALLDAHKQLPAIAVGKGFEGSIQLWCGHRRKSITSRNNEVLWRRDCQLLLGDGSPACRLIWLANIRKSVTSMSGHLH